MTAKYDEAERECIKKLAARFVDGKQFCPCGLSELTNYGLTKENHEHIIGLLANDGIIKNAKVAISHDLGYAYFEISGDVIHAVRAIESEEAKAVEKPDNVEEIKKMFRKHPFASWVIVIFLAYVAVIAAVSQTMNVLEKIGLTNKSVSATQP